METRISLLEYRNTPLDGVKLSPAQLLMGRRLKARLPTASKLLQPQLHRKAEVQKSLQDRQLKQKLYYDRGTRDLPALEEGEKVRLRTEKHWQPAVVVKKHEKPRSYLVQTQDGKVYRRNRKHLIKTKESILQHSHIQDSCDPVLNDYVPDEVTTTPVTTPITNPELLSATPEVTAGETVKVTRSGRVVRPPKRYSC